MRQRTLVLIAARQAQRGDFNDALATIPDITDANERDKALQLTIMRTLMQESWNKLNSCCGVLSIRMSYPTARSTSRTLMRSRSLPMRTTPNVRSHGQAVVRS